MTNSPSAQTSPSRAVVWTLKAVVLLQAAGLVFSTLREGTSLDTFLFVHQRTAESLSILIEQVGVGMAVLASLVAVFARGRGLRIAGASITAGWFALLAVMEAVIGGAPFTSWALPAHAVRVLAPVVLVSCHLPIALRIARGAVAVTFLVHGVEALLLHPQFVDYILGADLRLFGLGLSQSTAETLLRVIGLSDVIVALLVLRQRTPAAVLAWAAAWGFITAASRTVLGGSGSLHHTLIRVANGGLPLALLLLTWRNPMYRQLFRPPDRVVARAALSSLLVVLALPFVAGAQALNGQQPAHLRLVWTEDPAHRATVSWSTESVGSTHEVYLDTEPRNGVLSSYAKKVPAGLNGAYESGGPYYHHATVTDLQPATTYYFVIVSDGKVSPERHFITAHTDDRNFRLLFGGDSRSGISDRQKMNQLMARLVEEDPGIVALAHGGDYIQAANNWSEWNSWLDDHARTITSKGRVLPIIPARGNHEGDGSMFNEVFGFPGGPGVDYWTTLIGANFTFITLDSNISMGGDQRAWLEQQLKDAQGRRWIVPSYHRPAYPAVKSPSAALQYFVPLFEQYNVDVVCESDGHVLKRTQPIRNGKADPTGVVYVGEGGLGVPQRTPMDVWYLQSPGMAKSAHHVQVFSVTPQQLTYQAKLMTGELDDEYAFQPRRAGVVVEPEPEPETPGTEPGTEPGTNPEPEPEPVVVPEVASVRTISPTQVAVTFSVDVDASATLHAAYALAPAVEIRDITLVSPRTAVLNTGTLEQGTEYVLTVTDVRSTEGGAMSAAVQVPFQLGVDFTPLPGPSTTPIETPSCASASAGALGWFVIAAAGMLVRRRRRRNV